MAWVELQKHLVLDPFEWRDTCAKGHKMRVTLDNNETASLAPEPDVCMDYDNSTIFPPPRARVYLTRYERTLKLIAEANKPMNPLLMFAKFALESKPKGQRSSQVIRRPMSKVKFSVIACLVCLSIAIGLQTCSHYHIGVVSAKHTLGR